MMGQTHTGKTRRQAVLDAASDLVASFLYYDRKEDEDLGVGEIEAAIIAEEISIEEIIFVVGGVIRKSVAEITK